MDFSLLERAKEFLRAQRKKNIWYRTMCGLAAVVVFVTTYMLILPAITMERNTICGQEEHTHTDSCYEVVTIAPEKVLNCTEKALEIHEHTDKCYDSEHNLICGYADFIVHTHDKNCYDKDGKLVCKLDEINEHEHTASCYKVEQNLTCGQEVSEGHQHSEGCYTKEKGSLNCDVTEHTHGQACYDAEGNLICTQEAHTHNDNCYQWNKVQVCTQAESTGHTHTDACYENVKTLICDEQEVILHVHTDACHDENGKLKCGMLEVKEHQHTDKCFVAEGGATTEKKLVCEKEEHEHTDACYPVSDEDAANMPMLLANGDDGEGTTGETGSEALTTYKDLSTYITGVTSNQVESSASGDHAVYDPETGKFEVNFTLTFAMSKEEVNSNIVFTYALSESISVPEKLLNGGPYVGSDNSGKEAFQYWFVKTIDEKGNTHYSIQMQYLESYVNEVGPSGVTGYINFRGFADVSNTEENGSIKIEISDNQEIIIPSDQISYPDNETFDYDIKTEKSQGQVVQGEDGTYILYTVTVSSQKGTPDPINISDTLTANGLTVTNVILDSVIKTTTGGETSNIGGTLTGISSDYTSFNLSLQGLIGGETYTISYRYKLDDLADNTNTSVKNAVSATASDTTKGEIVGDGAESWTTVKKEVLSKTGSFNQSTGLITWTITVNKAGTDIAGRVLTDTMLGSVKKSEITIASSDGSDISSHYNILTDDNGYVTGIRFNAVQDERNTNTYIITYSTKQEQTNANQSVTNTASLGNGSESSGITGTGTVTVPAGGGIKKECLGASTPDANNQIQINWKFSFTVPSGGLAAETEIIDYINGEWSDGQKQWMTYSQICSWVNYIHSTEGSGINYWPAEAIYSLSFYSPENATWYSYAELQTNNGNIQALKFSRFKITFTEGLDAVQYGGKEYYIQYTTTADTSSVTDNEKYTNKIVSGDLSSEAEYTYQNKVVKLNNNGQATDNTVENADGILYWYVKVIVDGDKYSSFTVTDKLPANVQIQKVGIDIDLWNSRNKLIDVNSSESTSIATKVNVTVNGTASDTTYQTIVTEISNDVYISNGTTFYICYQCQVLDLPTEQGQSKSYGSLTNQVTVKSDKGDYGSDERTEEVTVTIPKDESLVIDKTGNWDNNSRKLNYSIVLNKGKEDLSASGNTLTVKDTLSYYYNEYYKLSVALIQGSVKLYYATVNQDGTVTKGAECTDWVWNYSVDDADAKKYGHGDVVHLIEATIPDKQTFILDYSYTVYADFVMTPNSWYNLNISNTVKLIGDSEFSDSDKRNDQWEISDTSAGIITDNSFVLYKVEKDNYGQVLKDAVFTLYNLDGTIVTRNGENVTYTTDEDGQIIISWDQDIFVKDVTYYIQETKAPDSYMLPSDPEKYYFYFGSSTDISVNSDGAANLNYGTKVVYAENEVVPEKTYTSINVKKVWKNKDGSELTEDLPESINFELYQIDNASGSGKSTYRFHSTTNYNETDETGVICYPAGTTVQFVINEIWNPGTVEVTYGGNTLSNIGSGTTYVYQFVVDDSSELVLNIGDTVKNDIFSFRNVTVSEGTIYGIYTVASTENWEKTISNLPLSEMDSEGITHNYSYYIREVAIDGYTVSYDEEGGISSGTITVTNVKTGDEKTSISVEKRWKTFSGADTTKSEGDVTFELYQVAHTEGGSSGDDVGGGSSDEVTVTFKLGKEWSADGSLYEGTHTYKKGTNIEFSIISTADPVIRCCNSVGDNMWNGTTIEFIKSEDSNKYVFKYPVKSSIAILGYGANPTSNWGGIIIQDNVPSDSADEQNENGILYNTYTVPAPSWKTTINGLPSKVTDDDGNVTTYTYYVKEISKTVEGEYTVEYSTEDDGTLVITNKSTSDEYELPETGGPGTRIAYTLGSILMLLASAAFLYIKKRNDGKKGGLA